MLHLSSSKPPDLKHGRCHHIFKAEVIYDNALECTTESKSTCCTNPNQRVLLGMPVIRSYQTHYPVHLFRRNFIGFANHNWCMYHTADTTVNGASWRAAQAGRECP